ncbi:MAG: cell division protein FtsL [Pseudomonadota bacterium]
MNNAGLATALAARVRSGLLQLQSPLVAAVVGVVLVSSAVAVAYSAHKSRLYLNALQQLEVERDRLETEWGQLLLEQHAWGAYGRIGKIAMEQLQMRNPAPAEIIMVRQ